MATIADKLTYLNETKTAIKNAIVSKGVAIEDTDTFRSYASKIGEISSGGSTEEWQPNPNWWDIKSILDADTREYAGKVGVILYNFNDVSDFELSSNGMTAVATSDGAFYSYADNGANVSHNWDTTQDKDDGRGFKTRWMIFYYSTGTTSDVFEQYSTKYGWSYNYIAYLVLRVNCSSGNSFCQGHRLLEGVDNPGFTITGTDFGAFLQYCYALRKLPDAFDTRNSKYFTNFLRHCYCLQKLPDELDTSSATGFNGFCDGCYSLTKLPDGLNTSNGTAFHYFCANCYSLTKLPDGLDTSNGTNFAYFCQNCYSLTELPEGLDTSKGTSFNNMLYACASLVRMSEISMSANMANYTSKYSAPFYNTSWIVEIPLTLPSNTNLWLDSSTRISIESFRYIADHAPDITATPRTLTVGSTNISRINAEDPTIITDLNAKGWTVA